MSVTTFHQHDDHLILKYAPSDGNGFVVAKLNSEEEATIRRVFRVTPELWCNVPPDDEEEMSDEFEPLEFKIGKAKGNYFQLDKDVLGIDYDLFISREIQLEQRHFIAKRDISIFGRLEKFNVSPIYIGGEHEDAIPEESFKQLVADFPTSTEVTKYAAARIDSILGEYLNAPKDFQADFEKYRNKRRSFTDTLPRTDLAPYESDKFSALHQKLTEMLEQQSDYSEHQWQEEILEIILLLFPRYIKAFREGPVRDSWVKKRRNVDFLLLDATGYIDVIEIKKPSFGDLITVRAGRGNFVPKKALSEAVMQVEKYLFHFNRWGQAGEKELNEKYKQYLPSETEVKIVNPNGMIIMGREQDFTPEQRDDFEVIRRKYRNVLDIITYDDLLRRLKTIGEQFEQIQNS